MSEVRRVSSYLLFAQISCHYAMKGYLDLLPSTKLGLTVLLQADSYTKSELLVIKGPWFCKLYQMSIT